jgi:hypothetical protein
MALFSLRNAQPLRMLRQILGGTHGENSRPVPTHQTTRRFPMRFNGLIALDRRRERRMRQVFSGVSQSMAPWTADTSGCSIMYSLKW